MSGQSQESAMMGAGNAESRERQESAMMGAGNAESRECWEPGAESQEWKPQVKNKRERPRKSWDTQRQPKTGDSNDTKNGWRITGVKLQESGGEEKARNGRKRPRKS